MSERDRVLSTNGKEKRKRKEQSWADRVSKKDQEELEDDDIETLLDDEEYPGDDEYVE